MQLNLKNILLHDAILKICSCIIGATLWYIITQSHATTIHLDLPVCFYNTTEQRIIDAPATVSVELSGKRSDLQRLDYDALAAHIDARHLHEGPNKMSITASTLFLPDQIKLLHYSPSNVIISVRTKTEHTNTATTMHTA